MMPVVTKPRISDTATVSDTIPQSKRLERTYAGSVFPRDKERFLFAPKAYLLGAVIGFTICCFLGWLTTTKNQFGDFHRFEVYSSPATFMYPSLAEMLAIARYKGEGGKTLVVIGASSIFNGVGQADDQLWSQRLQKLLGPNYAVVNLAQRSCNAFDGGYYAAEALVKEGRKVIFVTGGRPHGGLSPLGNPLYAYTYWDGLLAGKLMPYPDRERAIAEAEKNLPSGTWTQDNLTDLKLARLINRIFYCCELWNAVSWRYLNSTFNIYTGDNSFTALKKLPPYENQEFLHPVKATLQLGLVAERACSETFYSWNTDLKDWVEVPAVWEAFQKYSTLPQAMRGKVVYSIIRSDPYYWKRLTPQELKREKRTYIHGAATLKAVGIHAFQSGEDYQTEDYMDWQHLNPSGGNKLAAQTAVEVKRLARSLGYN